MEINVLYCDRDLLVCVKPAGTAVQTASLMQQDMVSILRSKLALAGEDSELHVVHRLDQPVEGLLVFARNSGTAALLDKQAASGRSMTKEYLACVEGRFLQEEGTMKHYLLRDGRTNTSRVSEKGEKGAKEARLRYSIMQYDPETDRSLIKVRLDTGRHHQIRVQMAASGHPIVGDTKYGNTKKETWEPLMLCAVHLAFTGPGGKRHEYTVEPSWLDSVM